MRITYWLLGCLVACADGSGATDDTDDTDAAAAGDVDCAALCEDKSLGCPNDDQCATQCEQFRATCTAEADVVIACNYDRPSSDFECNAISGTTQVKAGVCADELSAYLACQGS